MAAFNISFSSINVSLLCEYELASSLIEKHNFHAKKWAVTWQGDKLNAKRILMILIFHKTSRSNPAWFFIVLNFRLIFWLKKVEFIFFPSLLRPRLPLPLRVACCLFQHLALKCSTSNIFWGAQRLKIVSYNQNSYNDDQLLVPA